MKCRYINDIIKRAARRIQRCFEVFEGQPDLVFEIGFGRPIGTTADLPRHEQKITGSNSGGIPMFLVKGMLVGGEDCFAFGHS